MVALSVLAVKGLDKAQAGSASALISMLRNLGGAIGTALLTQLVSLRERFHSERIGETLTIFDGALQQRLGGGQVRIQLPEQQQALALLDHGAPAGLPDGLLRRLLPFLRGAPGLRPGLADAAPEGLNSVALGHPRRRGRNRGSAKRPGSGETWR